MAQKPISKIYCVTYCVDENPTTISIEGTSVSAYPLGDGGASAFCIYGEDGKNPVLMIAWDSFVCCRLSEETKILQVRKSKKVISLEAPETDDEKESRIG